MSGDESCSDRDVDRGIGNRSSHDDGSGGNSKSRIGESGDGSRGDREIDRGIGNRTSHDNDSGGNRKSHTSTSSTGSQSGRNNKLVNSNRGSQDGDSSNGNRRSHDGDSAIGNSNQDGDNRSASSETIGSNSCTITDSGNRNGSVNASPGARFREALQQEKPLQIAGAVNAYAAILAQAAGFRALYVSGAGVANASFGLPDLGITTLNDVTEDVRRIAGAVELPLLVDADTGFGSAFNIARTVRELIRAGAAGMHIEDQVAAKRCGHRPNKALVPSGEMADRIASAADARTDADFVLMARTDALATQGLGGAVARALAYVEAGADMIFLEAATSLEEYRAFTAQVKVPVLANVTEFGRTPLFTAEELGDAGVAMALYPLSAFRAMNAAALLTYRTIRGRGTQADVVGQMQTREELYRYLGYYEYERKLDELFDARRNPEEG